MMTEDEKVILIETEQRSKSNTHQIEEIKSDIKDIKQDQKAIYELTSSIKLVAQNVVNIQDDVKEIKQGQSDLSNKVDNQIKEIKSDVELKVGGVTKKVDDLTLEPFNDFKTTKREIKVKVLSGIGIAVATAVITYLCTLIGNGIIRI